MEHLDTRSIQTLLDAIREIYADLSLASLPDTIVKCASKIIPCDVVGHATVCKKNPRIDSEALSCTDELERWDVFNAYIHEHPYLALFNPDKTNLHPFSQDIAERLSKQFGDLAKSPEPLAVKISDMLTDNQFRSLTLFDECYRFNNIAYQLGAFLFLENSVIAPFFNRSEKDFTEKDRTLLNILIPHIIQAHKNAAVVSKLRNTGNGEGKMLLDGKAKDLSPETMKALGITLREAEILHWISLGKTNAEISAIFNISLNTVKTHQQRIYQKLGVENRVAAARFVMGNGEGI